MTDYDLVVANGTVVDPEHGVFKGDIGVTGDRIAAVASSGTLKSERVIDASDRYVLPGVIDPHTHHGLFRDLADDARTESRSGLVGGVTTIGNIYRHGGSYIEGMDEQFSASEANYRHDYFFTLGLLSHDHTAEVPAIVEELGITSFKWYMNYKLDVAEMFGLERNLLDDVADAFIRELADLNAPTTLAYHSENSEITARLTEEVKRSERDDYGALVEKFPGYAEAQSMVSGANLARHHGYDDQFYVVHISARETADELAELHEMGYEVTGETCTHYLTLTAEECDERMKINPPVRSAKDREVLWERLADGTIDCVGTDHIANRFTEKVGEDIWDSMWGSPSSATLLPLILSEGVNEDRISIERAAAVTSTNVAKAWDLYPKKGSLRPGTDADLVIVDLNETRTVTPELLQSAADYSMYTDRDVTGWPTHTIVRGEVAYENGEVVAEPGFGTHIDRPI
ncbi:dihydroorotase family protein [Halosolutus amylolyticus]|uniref:Dihydroorotase family protein n=1 Tax=Halosolutus amylolyticus TaxID=2932267 RepID=A0ABD5PJC4_9EURY|nr:amidohydrolase family protein [Halosolutus amylolyticus]